jgi:hypothetical protein
MRKTRRYATGLNLVPLSEVTNNGYEPPRVLAARLRREEQADQIAATKAAEEKLMAPLREVEQQVREAARDHSKRVAKYWSQPLIDLEDAIRHDEVLIDLGLALEQTTTPITMPEFEGRITKFVGSLATLNMTLSDDAKRRFALYCWVQATENGAGVTDETLAVMLDRCLALKIFREVTGEFPRTRIKRAFVKPETEKPEPTFDDIASTLSTQSDAGNKALKIAAVDAALSGPIREMWSAFAGSLYRNFNGFVFTEKQKCVFHEAMKERRMNWLRPTDYDLVRVALVRSHDLPAHLIYPKEQLQIDMESADMSKPEVWREFNRRERQLQGR